MTTAEHPPQVDSELMNRLIDARRLVRPTGISSDNREIHHDGGRQGDSFYRVRWSHDTVVRSTHGVNCTGSCSWQIFVKDGVITWEAQQTDYPSTGPDRAEYEPRGCPRGASFSWYTYSPTRVRYPYVRATLVTMYREAKAQLGDPVLAWESIVNDPDKAARYKKGRGLGGLVRSTWEEAAEIVAAAYVATVKNYGPDRTVGFTPIPAMSIVSFASGARFHQLIGGAMLSFYDWYADLPVASPQVFGDQTDVPESGDWWDAGYLIMWGSNLPLTRTPDAHWMVEARYRGQKVIAVAPDYADNVKFADEWMALNPGTDAALAFAMGHVILREFYEGGERPEYFENYSKTYTDLPFLVRLDDKPDGSVLPGKFLTAEDLTPELSDEFGTEHAAFKPCFIDANSGAVHVPGGTLGHRFSEDGEGRWNLKLDGVDPALSMMEGADGTTEVVLPRFDVVSTPAEDEERAKSAKPGTMVRGVPFRIVNGMRVTTVYDLMLANYGVYRDSLPGQWPAGYEDATEVGTPAWQENITNVSAAQAIRVAREYAANAVESNGRSMIIMGAGANHWFHADTMYRTFLTLTTLTGGQGVNGGGWAHYVGQEKVRPITGWLHLANGLDWSRPPRHQNQTTYWYLHTDQWRYEDFDADSFSSAVGDGLLKDVTMADAVAMAHRLGWMPHFPQFDQNPLALTQAAEAEGRSVQDFIVEHLKSGKLRFASEDPDAENNYPRCLSLWRSNLFGSSAKGTEYFLRHLLGTKNDVSAQEPTTRRPRDVVWRDEPVEGKLDLLLTMDFRMTSSTLLSDIVLPSATWYEKHDLNTTDMHPFVNSFSPAIAPPWQARDDWDTFKTIAKRFSELAEVHLGTQKDVVALTLQHDSTDALAYPHGVVRDWKYDDGVEPIPGVTMPKLVEVERDYTAIHDKYVALGPLTEKLGFTTKALTYRLDREVEYLKKKNGVVRGGVADGRPSLDTALKAAEMVLACSGTTNGHLATQGFRTLEKRTGVELHDLSLELEGKQITFTDTVKGPVPVITSPEWSGSESGGRRYSCFTINKERLKPWHTLTGRQHFYLDHDWMREFGENLPVYRPPLEMSVLFHEEGDLGSHNEVGLQVRYLTPHNKWAIHSQYQDNLYMLTLGRGGQAVWMSDVDAKKAGIKDNDWVEIVNRNGLVAARAVVSHRMPAGTIYMHHAQDRVVNVPLTETSGKRGGTHNSMTRIMVKPTHLIGGYAQQAFAFNYLGATGNNRDEVSRIRKRTSEVTY
ncbi:MAG: nitrate reductase subunit alpha [Dermabacter sp.]|nr:nitrate reductase subunit alpha [Dermabacter sp.]